MEEWETVTDDKWVMDIIRHSYLVPFLSTLLITSSPPPLLVGGEELILHVQKLLDKSAIEEVTDGSPVFQSCVSGPQTGWVRETSHRFEGTKCGKVKVVDGNDAHSSGGASVEMGDGYFTSPRALMLLAILCWGREVYQLRVFAFGLTTGPFVFSRVCKLIVAYLQHHGLPVHAYINDWLLHL